MNERTIRSRAGRRFTVRPMTEDDAGAVLDGFEHLSPASMRNRFFQPLRHLTAAVAADLVRIDEHNRIVLLAFDEDGHLAGGARAIRHPDDPATADLAVTVGDAYQRQGLGSKLLQLVGQAALAEGIDRLAGHVLVDNPGGRAMLIANGAMATFHEPGVLAFEIPLGRRQTLPPAVAARPVLGLAS